MSDVTAVVLSGRPYKRAWPELEVLVHSSRLSSAAGLHTQRMRALEKVRTPWFFFLDDDDDLPADYLSVLEDCKVAACAKAVDVVFAWEQIRTPRGDDVQRPAQYRRDQHLAAGIFLPHAMLVDTRAAREAAVPMGAFVTESVLYWELARKGAAVVPRTGYVWNRARGMHTRADFANALEASRSWCAEHP